MILATAFFFYFFSLVLFSLIRHPVYYCVLLVLNSLICSFICYAIYGFGWYSILFCLVYIGGVYILFVFVSVHNPNRSVISYWNFSLVRSFLTVFLILMTGVLISYVTINTEFRRFLCNISEGPLYLCMCLTLLFGFFILSLIMRVKLNHYR